MLGKDWVCMDVFACLFAGLRQMAGFRAIGWHFLSG